VASKEQRKMVVVPENTTGFDNRTNLELFLDESTLATTTTCIKPYKTSETVTWKHSMIGERLPLCGTNMESTS